MNSTFNNTAKSNSKLTLFPCLLVHQGDAGHGDEDWKNTVVLFTSESTGTIVHCGKDLKYYKLGEVVSCLGASNLYWKLVEGRVILEN